MGKTLFVLIILFIKFITADAQNINSLSISLGGTNVLVKNKEEISDGFNFRSSITPTAEVKFTSKGNPVLGVDGYTISFGYVGMKYAATGQTTFGSNSQNAYYHECDNKADLHYLQFGAAANFSIIDHDKFKLHASIGPNLYYLINYIADFSWYASNNQLFYKKDHFSGKDYTFDNSFSGEGFTSMDKPLYKKTILTSNLSFNAEFPLSDRVSITSEFRGSYIFSDIENKKPLGINDELRAKYNFWYDNDNFFYKDRGVTRGWGIGLLLGVKLNLNAY